jgi:hypothetical protein
VQASAANRSNGFHDHVWRDARVEIPDLTPGSAAAVERFDDAPDACAARSSSANVPGITRSAGMTAVSSHRPLTKRYPWIIRSTAMVNHYYVYLLDRDFGPPFIKFCSYCPYPAKLCLNGHEWLKRQLTQRDVAFAPLDNGIRSTAAPTRVQRIADTLDAAKIDAVYRK